MEFVSLLLGTWYFLEGLVKACIPWCCRRRKDVQGEITLVTGAGSGLGRLLAVEFAKRKAILVLWDVNQDGNDETARIIRDIGGTAHAYKVDLTNEKEVYEVAAKVKGHIGDVTILVNNAGVVTGKRLLDCPDHMIKRTMDVNVTSHFWTLKAFLPAMMAANRGHIVTLASLAGFFPVKNLVDYCTSKFAAVGLHQTLRLELQADGLDGIHMTLVCPTYVGTGMFKGVQTNLLNPEEVVSKTMDAILLNEGWLCLPSYAKILIPLSHIAPEKLNMLVKRQERLHGMDTFVGRNGKGD